MSCVLLRKLAIQGMDSGFGGRHGEDEPSFADIERAETEHVPEEGAIGFGIIAVQQKMGAGNHVAEYIGFGERGV